MNVEVSVCNDIASFTIYDHHLGCLLCNGRFFLYYYSDPVYRDW